ncbi:MAG: hypothetical protein WD825_14460 [Gemmatimonadaceae bacterium]
MDDSDEDIPRLPRPYDALTVAVDLQNVVTRGERLLVPDVRIHTGVMSTCLPADLLDSLHITREQVVQVERPDGQILERAIGAAILTIVGRSTVDNIIFGEPGDAIVIGWRALTGLNLEVDNESGHLVDRGPIPAASVY